MAGDERFDTASDAPCYYDSSLLACCTACCVHMCFVHAHLQTQKRHLCTITTNTPDGLVLGLKDLCALTVLLSLAQSDF